MEIIYKADNQKTLEDLVQEKGNISFIALCKEKETGEKLIVSYVCKHVALHFIHNYNKITWGEWKDDTCGLTHLDGYEIIKVFGPGDILKIAF